MRQATSQQSWLVLGLHHEPPHLRNIRFRREVTKGFALYGVESEKASSPLRLDGLLQECGYVRLFERFYFLASDCSLEHKRLVRSFFDWLSPRYDLHNTKGQNAACYDYLLRYSEIDPAAYPSIVDFGCGSGAIVDSRVPAIAGKLCGYDISPGMASAAREKGLDVLSQTDFEALSRGSIDLVMCSYVLHYGITKRQLNHLLSLLTPNGSLVGNLHKDFGTSLISRHLESLPRETYVTHWCRSKFGRCLRIKKHSPAAREH